jgi:hypothetical protein
MRDQQALVAGVQKVGQRFIFSQGSVLLLRRFYAAAAWIRSSYYARSDLLIVYLPEELNAPAYINRKVDARPLSEVGSCSLFSIILQTWMTNE